MRIFCLPKPCCNSTFSVVLAALALVAPSASAQPDPEESTVGPAGFHQGSAGTSAAALVGLPSTVEQATLQPPREGIATAKGELGFSVSLSGNRALIGSIRLLDTGAVIVLRNTGNGWVQETVLFPSESDHFAQFGRSVSLSGNRALIGAPHDNDNGNGSGAAYVFEFDGTAWNEIAKLTASDGAAQEFSDIQLAFFKIARLSAQAMTTTMAPVRAQPTFLTSTARLGARRLS